jgi:hypothetical protein
LNIPIKIVTMPRINQKGNIGLFLSYSCLCTKWFAFASPKVLFQSGIADQPDGLWRCVSTLPAVATTRAGVDSAWE